MNAGPSNAGPTSPDNQGGLQRRTTPRELRLTAALYTQRKSVLDHVRAIGELPPDLGTMGCAHIGMRLLMERRGTDIVLTPDVDLVLQAIQRAGSLPNGSVVLVDDEIARQDAEREEAGHAS